MSGNSKTFGKYEILDELGRGGFATVYRARDTTLGREVALKVLAPHRAWEADFAQRFVQEAQVAAQLKHPNIVTIHEIGDVEGQLFIAMELVTGGSLRRRMEQAGRLSTRETVEILTPIASALDHAHSRGIVHRDVKPANILLDPTDDGPPRAVLTDFGLVKALSQSTALTQSGEMLGTVEYMAPEQADTDLAHEIGPATDIYALGVVAFHMLTGRVPFTDSSAARVLVAHLTKQPPNPADLRADLPDHVAEAILKALEKRPEDRFSSATAFVQALAGRPSASTSTGGPSLRQPSDSEQRLTSGAVLALRRLMRRTWFRVALGVIILMLAYFGGKAIWGPRITTLTVSPPRPVAGEPLSVVWATDNTSRIDILPLAKGLPSWGSYEVEQAPDLDKITFVASRSVWRVSEAIYLNAPSQGDYDPEVTAVPSPTIVPSPTADAGRPDCTTARAELDAIDADDCAQVIKTASAFIDGGCRDVSLLHDRANCYGDLGQSEAALADFATAIELDPAEPWSYIYRSKVYKNLGENDLRLADLNTAVEVAPGDPQTYFFRADYYQDMGDLQSALDDLERAIALGPAEPDYYDERGKIYLQQGDQAAAARDFEKVVELSAGIDYYAERRAELEAWLEATKQEQRSVPAPGSIRRMRGNTAVFSPDGSRIATQLGETIHIWDAFSGEQVMKLAGHQDWVSSIRFSPDGQRIASSSYDGTAMLWDADSGERLLMLAGHTDKVNGVRFSPDGRVATFSLDRSVRLWDSATGAEVRTLADLAVDPMDIAFSRDGKRIVIALWTNADIWEVQARRRVISLQTHTDGIFAVDWSPVSDRIVTAGKDGMLLVWDARDAGDGLILQKITAPTGGCFFDVSFGPDEERILAACSDGTARLWDASTGSALTPLIQHGEGLSTAKFSPDGAMIVTAGDDLVVRVWDAETGEELTAE